MSKAEDFNQLVDRAMRTPEGAKVNLHFVQAKIKDYRETHYDQKLDLTLSRLDDTIRSKLFYDEMTRFIPTDILSRTLEKDKFLTFLINENRELLLQIK